MRKVLCGRSACGVAIPLENFAHPTVIPLNSTDTISRTLMQLGPNTALR
jgi:hypothetical protein